MKASPPKLIFVLCTVLSIFLNSANAQELFYPLGFDINNRLNVEINSLKYPVHTSFKPVLQSDIPFTADTAVYMLQREQQITSKYGNSLLLRKFFTEDFISVNKKNFVLKVNPLFYLQKDYLKDSIQNLFINTRGIEIKGNLGGKLSFYSSFRENQAFFREYTDTWINSRKVVPGQGATKPFNETGHDFAMATAYLSYTPAKWVNIQTGNDKNFIGDGYRSMLLSDNSFAYPFLKLSLKFRNFKYTTMIAEFRDFETVYYHYHFKKHFAANYLSYNYKNIIEIGLFEAAIYKTQDTSLNYYNKFPTDFYIPVIGVRTAVNRFDNIHHILTGFNLKISPFKYLSIYAQTATDNIEEKNISFQAGAKFYDFFLGKIKNNKLFILVEYNKASPRIYSHDSIKHQTWTHYNQEIAHPAGKDFSEIISIVKYSYRNFSLQYKYNKINLNRSGTYSDIYSLNNLQFFTIPYPETIKYSDISASWIINPRTDLQIFLGTQYRTHSAAGVPNVSQYYFFGLKTNLSNFYYDY